MAMKINVGLQKKVGQPNYGSLGASCQIEFEMESTILESNMDGFHNRVNGAFLACRQAVNLQLERFTIACSGIRNFGTSHRYLLP